jgi:succinyl-diaminopimelate desuccinylase
MKQSIIDLATALVRIPSRAGIDPSERILDYLSDWLSQHSLTSIRLRGPAGTDVGLYVHLKSGVPGPAVCLNACIDTAPFGTGEAWRYAPTSGTIEDGRLFGRGAADSKMGVAIFSHLGVTIHETDGLQQGELYLVFDADEHTGKFQGIKRFLDVAPRPPDAVLIGYPGNNNLVVGSRGFLRAVITVFGLAAHSGSSARRGFNAIKKMAHLIEALHTRPLPEEPGPDFSFGPQINVTEVTGGEGFSLVPDRCCCKVDFRLTPNVNQQVAKEWIRSIVQGIDLDHPGPRPTRIAWEESWLAYRVPTDSPLVTQFLDAAQEVFGRAIPPRVSGPSNIGNYLASRGIPALSGFGVTYSNIHATDESAELESVMPVYETYRRVISRILHGPIN